MNSLTRSHSLIDAELDEGKIVRGELVIAGRDTPTLLNLMNRSTKFRALYRYGLKQIASLRFRFGGMFAHAPCWLTSALIQSASARVLSSVLGFPAWSPPQE